MSGTKKLEKGEYLFHQGDPSDCMFVIKTGRIAITQPTNSGDEIELAQLAPGAMLGEMAFFDNKPRSASAKALQQTVCIVLPFKALHAQFKAFPEWSKAIMKTVNDHLRNANKRIKDLEKMNRDESDMFPPHSISKLVCIFNFVTMKFGQQTKEGHTAISSERLRKYTIQVFQEPTHKMQKLTEVLQGLNFVQIDNMGDGIQRIVVFNPEQLQDFVEWYNTWLFAKDEDRILVKEEELRIVRALIHFGKQETPDEKGVVKVSLTKLQNKSMEELSDLVRVDEVNSLEEKKLITEKMMVSGGGVYTTFVLKDLQAIVPYWQLIYTLRKIKRD